MNTKANDAESPFQASPLRGNGNAKEVAVEPPVKNGPNSWEASSGKSRETPDQQLDLEEMVTIKRTYVYAGETISEDRSVPKSSAEAKEYLESKLQSPEVLLSNRPPLRRPKKRVSRFEPNPQGIVGGLPAGATNAPKLNVVQKSKLDWAGYVDKEGMQDELKVAERAKDGYHAKVEFLDRVDAKREEELRSLRLK